MRSVLVLFLIVSFLCPQSVALLGPAESPTLVSPSVSEVEKIISYNAMRAENQVLDFMALNWTESTPDSLSETEDNDEFIPVQRERIIHTEDYNETVDPIVLFSKYGNSSVEDPRDVFDGPIGTLNENSLLTSPPPTKMFPALPMSPAKSGHWFRKKGYSALAFEWDYPSYLLYAYICLDIERDQDIYSRTLTVYFDGNIVYQAVIGSGGFHGSIPISYIPAGTHKVEVQINWCGWKENQWKMTHIWPWIDIPNWPDEPIPDFWEYFPGGNADDINPTLDYQVMAGKSTYFDIYIENEGGSPFRTIEIWFKTSYSSSWYLKTSISSGVPYRLYMGYITTDYYIRLKLLENPASYYQKKLTYNCVNYREVKLEVDYMTDSGGNPLMSISNMNDMLEYVKTYYILHGYQRPDYYIDSAIPFEESYSPLTVLEWEALHLDYYSHQGSSIYQWLLIGNSFYYSQYTGGAYYEENGYEWGCAIFHHALYLYSLDPPLGEGYGDYIDVARSVLLHEFGHFAGIIEYYWDWWAWEWRELYCSNEACCMSRPSDESFIPDPWYCAFHWSLRKERWKP
ncbi:MAG: hypothetical protein ACFFF9_11260 [Candidatus Thorarchaeota archaeon]